MKRRLHKSVTAIIVEAHSFIFHCGRVILWKKGVLGSLETDSHWFQKEKRAASFLVLC